MRRLVGTLAVSLFLLGACSASLAVSSPRALAGSLDLTAWSWASGTASLDGEWTFDGRPMAVPSGLKFGDSPYGSGTYRLLIKVPADSPVLALRLPIVGTAFELLDGDQVLAREGVVSSDPAAGVPSYRPRIVLLPPAPGGVIDLRMRVSNWHDQFAGLYFGATLGPWEQVQFERDRAALWEALVFGALFLMGLYHLGSFFFRTANRAPLWFGLFCILVALRSTLYSEVLFLAAFPDTSWFFVIRGVHATMALALATFAAFLDRLYPDLSVRPVVFATIGVGAAYASVNLWGPVSWTTGLLVPFQIVMVVFAGYALFTVGRALVKREPGALLFVAGFAVFTATIVLDIVKNHWFWNIPSLVNLGFVFVLLSQSLVVARLFATAFATAETHSAAMQKINLSLERFIPKEVLGFLGKNSITEISLGDFSEQRMSVFFLDIRDFTTLSETMSPRENFRFINSFLNRFGPLIRDHGGFVDKYLGDGIMALFPGSPDDALKAALAMRRVLAEYNQGRLRGGYAPIRFGIGIHTGPLMLGTIGENLRMDSTVISDTVNAASRLEGLTKKYGTDILLSGSSVEGLTDREAFPTRFVALETVKGKTKPLEVFLVLDGSPDDPVAEGLAATGD